MADTGENVEVLVCLPSYDGKYDPEMYSCFEAMVGYSIDQGLKLGRYKPRGSNISSQRQKCVQKAQERNAKHLLFIDVDVVFPPDLLVRLLGHEVDIVGGMYTQKTAPYYPLNARYDEENDDYPRLIDWEPGELIEDILVCCGTMLIDMKVFDVVEEPHWLMDWLPKQKGYTTEDVYFCKKAMAAGVKTYLDTSILIAHMGQYPFTVRDYFNSQEREENKRIVTPQEVAIEQARVC